MSKKIKTPVEMHGMAIKKSTGDKIFDVVNAIILLALSVFTVMLSLSRGKTNHLYGAVLLVNLAAYIFYVIVP